MRRTYANQLIAAALSFLMILPMILSGCAAASNGETTVVAEAAVILPQAVQTAVTQAPAEAGSYVVSLDINPSIELMVENGLVTEGLAYNDDGQSILLGASVVGLSAEDAVDAIIKALNDQGYFAAADTKPTLIVTVSNGQMVTEEVADRLEEKAEGALSALNVECEVKSAYISDENAQAAAAAGLSAGRYMLLNYIAKVEDITLEEAVAKYAGMKIGALLDLYKGARSVFRDNEIDEDWAAFLSKLTPEQQAAIRPALDAFLKEIRAAQDAFHLAFKVIKDQAKAKVAALKAQYGSAKSDEYKSGLKAVKETVLSQRREALSVRKEAVKAAEAKFLAACTAAGIPAELLDGMVDKIESEELENEDLDEGLLETEEDEDEDEDEDQDEDDGEDGQNKGGNKH